MQISLWEAIILPTIPGEAEATALVPYIERDVGYDGIEYHRIQ